MTEALYFIAYFWALSCAVHAESLILAKKKLKHFNKFYKTKNKLPKGKDQNINYEKKKIIKRLSWKTSSKYLQPVCGPIYGRTVLIAQIIHHFCCCFTGCNACTGQRLYGYNRN